MMPNNGRASILSRPTRRLISSCWEYSLYSHCMLSTRLWGNIEKNTVPGGLTFSFNKSCTFHTHLNDTIYFLAFWSALQYLAHPSQRIQTWRWYNSSYIIHISIKDTRKCPLANFLASTYIFNCNVFLVYVF